MLGTLKLHRNQKPMSFVENSNEKVVHEGENSRLNKSIQDDI